MIAYISDVFCTNNDRTDCGAAMYAPSGQDLEEFTQSDD